MLKFNGTNIKDIMHNGAYIQTVMQNGNTLYQRTKPLADGAYIQTVNGDTFTEAEYTDLFSSLQTVTRKGETIYAVSDYDTSHIYTIESGYDTAVYTQVSFYDGKYRDACTIVEVIILTSTNEVQAIKPVANLSYVGTTDIKYYANDSGTGSMTGRVSRYTVVPKDKTVNGFLFKKGDHKVLCASTIIRPVDWGYYSAMSGVPALSLEEAKQDFNGVQNTETMVSRSDYLENGAAKVCKNYQFPSGKYGYLPACGELNVMANYITEYRNLYDLINGISTGDMFIWSSTQYDYYPTMAYVLNVTKVNEGINTGFKGSSYEAVPFQVIE